MSLAQPMSLGEDRNGVKLKIHYRPLKYTHTAVQGTALLWPLYLGLSPSLAALSGENVSPSFSFSFSLFCFSDQVTQDSYDKDKETQTHITTQIFQLSS